MLIEMFELEYCMFWRLLDATSDSFLEQEESCYPVLASDEQMEMLVLFKARLIVLAISIAI